MKQSRVSAFARVVRWSGRFGRAAVLAAVGLAVGAGSLLAQGSTGKLEGRVRDQSGAPVANAQVIIVGTAFNATTNTEGYYFINNVPAGVIDVRAQFVGYRPTQVANVRMLAGQTITQDITMEATPVEITELTVVEAVQPLVPRDEVTTKQRVSGEYTDRLPVDRINQVLALQPGVVASTSGNTLSIRGSRSDESATYIDGIPTQRGQRGGGFVDGSGSAGVTVGTNALEEASVTTGASSSEFGNAQAGIISLQTRAGSAQGYNGSISFETDEVFGKGAGVGYNRLQASLGGPTRLMDNLTFYVSGVLEGQKSGGVGGFPGIDSDAEPIFVRAGIDTIVASGTRIDTVYNFAVARGDCDAFSGSSNADIANNYGMDSVSGIRSPTSHGSAYQVQGKLNYSYGTGSRLALSYIGSQANNRLFSLANLYNPDTQLGNQAWSNYWILNWTQNLTRSTERALALETNLSYQADRFLQSPFAQGAAPDPGFLGFRVSGYDFLYDFDQWDGEDIAFDEDLIASYRKNDLTAPRAPCILPVKDPSDCNVRNQIRNNAYGLSAFNESGGPVGRLQMYRENRIVGRSTLDWQFDRYNRLRAGGEMTVYDLDFYSHQINSQAFSDAYMEEPIRYAFFAEDRLDLGDVVLIGGLRYDYYNSRASRPYFVCDATQDAADGNADGTCGGVLEVGERQRFPRIVTNPNLTDPTDPEAVDALFVRDESHDYLSPHIQVSFPVTDRTNFRLSYAHQVQAPDFGLILGGINTDLAITNTNNVYGSDLDFGRTISFEFGIRHAFSDDMVLDIAAYNRDNLANAAGRLVRLYDPFRRNETDIRLLTNADFGNARGIDLRLDRRFGNLFNGTVAYSYSSARNTGSDPFTYINFGSRVINQLSGGNQPPPQAIAPTSLSRPHVLAAAASLTFPNDWQEGTTLGSVLQNFSVYTTFRYQSGTAYTLCEVEQGNESVFSGGVCAEGGFEGGLNAARLPAFKDLSMVFRKGFSLGGVEATAYLDARNILNLKNITSVFVQTQDIRNEAEREINFTGDSTQFATQAEENGLYGADGSIDLTFGGAAEAGCGGFLTSGGSPAVGDCVYLIRAEQRYGDGDGVFTLAEQQAASDALYMVNRGVSSFTGDGRRLRLGLELNF